MLCYSVGFQMPVPHFLKFYQRSVLKLANCISSILDYYWNVKTYWKHCMLISLFDCRNQKGAIKRLQLWETSWQLEVIVYEIQPSLVTHNSRQMKERTTNKNKWIYSIGLPTCSVSKGSCCRSWMRYTRCLARLIIPRLWDTLFLQERSK